MKDLARVRALGEAVRAGGLRANYRRWRAQLWPGSPDTLKRMDQHVDATRRALPSPRAPKTPVPFESVKRELDGLARALDTVASVRGSEP